MTFQSIIRASSSVPAGAWYFSRAEGPNKHVKRSFSEVPRRLLPTLDRVPLIPHEGQAGSLPASSIWPILPPPSPASGGIGEQMKGHVPLAVSRSSPSGFCLPGPGTPAVPPSVILTRVVSLLSGLSFPAGTWKGC